MQSLLALAATMAGV